MIRKFATILGTVLVALGSTACHHSPPSPAWTVSLAELETARIAYRKAGFYWEAKEIGSPPLRDEDNAASLLTKSLAGQSSFRSSSSILVLLRKGDRRGAERALQGVQDSLKLARQASKKPHLDFHPDWDKGSTLPYPEIMKLKYVISNLCAEADLLVGEGKFQLGMDDLRAARRISNMVGEGQVLISILVAIACDAMTLKSVEILAASLKGNKQELHDPEEVLRSTMFRADWLEMIKREAYLKVASLRNLRADYWRLSWKDSEEMPTLADSAHLQRTGYPTDPLPRRLMLEFLTSHAMIAPILKEADSRPIAFERDKSEIGNKIWPPNSKQISQSAMLFSEWPEAANVVSRCIAQDRCTLALVDALEIQAQTGSFPKSIGAIPGSWIDPFNGKPLHLKLTKGGIRIYSLGPDMQDFGGVGQQEVAMFAKDWNVGAGYPPILTRPIRGGGPQIKRGPEGMLPAPFGNLSRPGQ